MLSNEFKQSVESVVGASITLDSTSKELFVLAHNEYLKCSSPLLKSLNKEMNEYLKNNITSDIVRSGVKRIFNVAHKYSELKALTYLDKLVYDNIRNAITLLTYISKDYDDKGSTLKSVKNKLSRVKNDDNYNNSFRSKILELKAEYKIIVTDDDEVIKLTGTKVVNTVANNIDVLTPAQRLELIALLQA